MRETWTKQETEILKNNYGKISILLLRELFPNRTSTSIASKARKLNLKYSINRMEYARNKVNDNFFSDINSISCYYAGLIAADGNISSGNRKICSLHQKDRSVIDQAKYYLSFEGKVEERIKKNGNRYYHIRVTSSQICEDLKNNFNIIPRKSLILKAPDRLDYFYSMCFLTGYVDGDGSIGIGYDHRNRPFMTFNVIGTYDMCSWTRKLIGSYMAITKRGNIYSITYTREKAISIINNFKSAKELENIRFSRKWDRILEYEQNL